MALRHVVPASALLAGVALGVVLSDVATFEGFPHKRYLVELQHDSSARGNYICTRTGAALGDNFSHFDFKTERQTDCLLGLTGRLNPDGSFDAYTGWMTWRGRQEGYAVNLPASRIKSVRPL